MKYYPIAILILFSSMACSPNSYPMEETSNVEVTENEAPVAEKQLRHVVLFKFKEGTSEEDIKKIEDAFAALPGKIPEIKAYEWGINNSPEGLDKGFTHCFFLTFDSEEDRAVYLPHPDQKAFGAILGPHLDDVLVVDYWTSTNTLNK